MTQSCTPLKGPYGRWKVLSTFRENGTTLCSCICSCRPDNKPVLVRASNLVTGTSKSCGCIKIEENKARTAKNAWKELSEILTEAS